MIEEKILLTAEEKRLLRSVIGTRMRRIHSEAPYNFSTDFIWQFFIDCEGNYLKLETMELFARLFDSIEDGSRPSVTEAQHARAHDICVKRINRIIRDVLIADNMFEFEAEAYKITWSKAIIFCFDDCNLVIEKLWLFSLSGFIVRLEPLDADDFNLSDETQFWFDPNDEESVDVPRITQTIESLKLERIVSLKHDLHTSARKFILE